MPNPPLLKPGAAFRYHYTEEPHPWLVAYQDDQNIVTLNFSTWRGRGDSTCIVKPAEYEELNRDSNIVYTLADLSSGDEEIEYLRKSIDKYITPIPDKLLERIIDGAKTSPYIKPKIQQFFLKSK